MPYPLPDDINAVTDLKWFLVAVPDDPAYTRAAMDAYTGLAQFWQWGKEGPVPTESDLAAQQWADAIYATLELIKMGFPELLLGYVDEVEGLLQSLQALAGSPCCDQITPGGEQVTTDVTPGVGTVPDYGEIVVADWDEWYEHLCYSAHLYVDARIYQADQLVNLLTAGALILGAIVSILTFGATLGLILAVDYALAASVTLGLLSAGGLAFTDAAADFEAARDDIVCAIMNGTSLPDAVEAALDPADWGLFFRILDYDSHVAQLYNGTGIDASARDDCDCTPPANANETVCFGSGLGNDQFQSQGIAGCHQLKFWWDASVDVTATQLTGNANGCGGVNKYRLYSGATGCNSGATIVYNSNADPAAVTCNLFVMIRNGPFTAEVTWTDT